jgi:hypothetical protein
MVNEVLASQPECCVHGGRLFLIPPPLVGGSATAKRRPGWGDVRMRSLGIRRSSPRPACGERSRASLRAGEGESQAGSDSRIVPLTRRLCFAPSPTSPRKRGEVAFHSVIAGASEAIHGSGSTDRRWIAKDISVVPAHAGTHNPCRSFERHCSMTLAQQLRACGYGSLRSQGRRT